MRARVLAGTISLFLLAGLASLPAGAQESTTQNDTLSGYQVDEIVITGTRTYKRIIDVPYPIERVEQSDFKFQRKITVDDILGDIPGLFLQSRYGNHDVRISLRGFGSRSNSGIRGVRILMDGIPESEPDGQTRIEAIDFQSLGSIEVVKGNASSLYTNAPGGVINFLSDTEFQRSFLVSFNQFGSFGLRQNGFKTGVRTDDYGLLATYSYHNADGYRAHSEDFWHIFNNVVEVNPGDNSTLSVYSYIVDGLIRLPGSLTKEQFDTDPFQANARDVARDTKRITKKGRVGLRFETTFDEHQNELELTAYGTTKYFERAAATYRIFNRNGFGASTRWVNHSTILGNNNEFSLGGDWFYQTGPIEEYENLNGKKSDLLLGLTDETIGNIGFYIQNTFTLVPDRVDVLVSGRYDNVLFDARNQIFEVSNARRRFEDFTPKVALNFKITPTIAAYSSYGSGFDTPAGNELDNPATSSNPNILLNPDLMPQHSTNFEIGVKGSVLNHTMSVFNRIRFEATVFNSVVDDEIVPYEVVGEVYYRNAAQTNRTGIELGLDADIVKGLRFRGAYTFSAFTYDQYAAGTIEIDSIGNFITSDRDFSGNTVPTVPKHNLSVSASYEHGFLEHFTGFVKAGYVLVSGMYVDDANSAITDTYRLVNSLVGLDFTSGGFNALLSVGANNIFDERYVAFININSTNGQFYEPGEPRNYFVGVDLGYTF
jgi:iron complex outermembrane receptor protein